VVRAAAEACCGSADCISFACLSSPQLGPAGPRSDEPLLGADDGHRRAPDVPRDAAGALEESARREALQCGLVALASLRVEFGRRPLHHGRH
jgi:hypothetical protein